MAPRPCLLFAIPRRRWRSLALELPETHEELQLYFVATKRSFLTAGKRLPVTRVTKAAPRKLVRSAFGFGKAEECHRDACISNHVILRELAGRKLPQGYILVLHCLRQHQLCQVKCLQQPCLVACGLGHVKQELDTARKTLRDRRICPT